ncbi:Hypothetical protein BHW_0015101 (plasmid) [Borrelia hermsii MTW]|uniref:BBH37-like helical domain-containing protein n=1 Tax=Borrelia hermsii MTW TaxID=1313291 RepID=W5T687_BORHE|nr:Hypothetical protein BHW_0015101 [Borrelia hermsii MTW]
MYLNIEIQNSSNLISQEVNVKKSILAVCMLTLLCLLSCDIDALNELLIKAREKFSDENKNIEGSGHNQEDKEEQLDVVKNMEERGVRQVVQGDPVASVNDAIPVLQYPQQETIEIGGKDLIPSTKKEKEAEAEIEKVKSALGNYEFAKLIEDACKLKGEYEQLESSFYDILSDLQRKTNSYPRKSRIERQNLIQLQNKLKINLELERLINQVEEGLNELQSAKFFFEKAQGTLKEAIAERLKNALRPSFRRVANYLLVQLSREAQRYAGNSLGQLESSSIKLNEANAKKKEIEELIEEAKSSLAS